jgi:hypothetical protein
MGLLKSVSDVELIKLRRNAESLRFIRGFALLIQQPAVFPFPSDYRTSCEPPGKSPDTSNKPK